MDAVTWQPLTFALLLFIDTLHLVQKGAQSRMHRTTFTTTTKTTDRSLLVWQQIVAATFAFLITLWAVIRGRSFRRVD